MVYVNLYKPISSRNFIIKVILFQGKNGKNLRIVSSEGREQIFCCQTLRQFGFSKAIYKMDIDSLRMVYVYFHKPIYHRDFSMTVLLKIIYGQDTYSVMYFGVCLTSCLLCHAPVGRTRHVMRGP